MVTQMARSTKITSEIDAGRPGSASRRRFLAVGSAATILTGLHMATAAAAELSPLLDLIEAHRVALQAFEVICVYDDWTEEGDHRRAPAEQEYHRLNAAEDDTLISICAYPARTAMECRAKAEYLLDYFQMASPTEGQVNALLRSIIDGEEAGL
jgi:hypothetical protein